MAARDELSWRLPAGHRPAPTRPAPSARMAPGPGFLGGGAPAAGVVELTRLFLPKIFGARTMAGFRELPMRQANDLAGLALLTLAGGGCIATRPYVRTQGQRSEAGTQERVDSVEQRVGTVERDARGQEKYAPPVAGSGPRRGAADDRGYGEAGGPNTRAGHRQSRARHQGRYGGARCASGGRRSPGVQETEPAAGPPASKTTEPAADLPASTTPQPAGGPPEIFVIHFAVADSRLDNSSRMTLTRALKRLQQNPAPW